MNGKKAVLLIVAIALLFSATGCVWLKHLDVVGQGAIASFETLVNTIPDQISKDGNGGWSLQAPDGAVSLIWHTDWSQNPLYDVMLQIDATPFLAAGLAPDRLPANYSYDGDTLMVGVKLGESALLYTDDTTPIQAFEQIVSLRGEAISYHTIHDHFSISLGDGNTFMWAKDLSINERDIVFHLNPQPLIDAGVDPNVIDGWTFTKVETHVDHKLVQADKIIKTFNLQID